MKFISRTVLGVILSGCLAACSHNTVFKKASPR